MVTAMKAAGRSIFIRALHLVTTLRSEMHCTAIVCNVDVRYTDLYLRR